MNTKSKEILNSLKIDEKDKQDILSKAEGNPNVKVSEKKRTVTVSAAEREEILKQEKEKINQNTKGECDDC